MKARSQPVSPEVNVNRIGEQGDIGREDGNEQEEDMDHLDAVKKLYFLFFVCTINLWLNLKYRIVPLK